MAIAVLLFSDAIKFWNGAHPIIQKGLWRDNLNPETSLWDVVVAQAEVIEISENVAERRDHQANSALQGGSSHQQNDQNQTRNKPFDQAAQSASYDNRAHNLVRSGGRFRSKTPRALFNQEKPTDSTRVREGSSQARGASAQRESSNTKKSPT